MKKKEPQTELTEKYKQLALKAIEAQNLVFIDECPTAIGIHKSTFYLHKLNESDEIKEALRKNRVEIKRKLRGKWYDSENATTQIALYKLIADDDEAEKLNGKSEVKVTGLEEIIKRLSNTEIE